MNSSLPEQRDTRRLVFGGCALTILASAVNVHFLIRLGLSVSHMTGGTSRLAIDLAASPEQNWGQALQLLLVVLGFVSGAALSGYRIHHPRFAIEQPYGRMIRAIGAVLFVAWLLEEHTPVFAMFLASVACGFQNAMATRYRGVVLRTTHITGVLTDLGQLLGMHWAGRRMESWQLFLHLSILLSFVFGALAGSALHLFYPRWNLLVLAMAYLLGGTGWSLWKHRVLQHRMENGLN